MSSDIASGILETARSLGMDPYDLATIISYETAGTFDPSKAGPTTQWGQHRGLIQFGEPQAREYGVDWSNPTQSQLGADGAVANYFRKNGWQEGMDLTNAYSIVNAGGPNLQQRTDENNGGAPGTVAEKVRDQMGGHRRNAERLLGEVPSQSAPTTVRPQGQPTMQGQPPQAPQGVPDGNALAQMAPPPIPEYRNSLNVADFMRPTQQNALTRSRLNG